MKVVLTGPPTTVSLSHMPLIFIVALVPIELVITEAAVKLVAPPPEISSPSRDGKWAVGILVPSGG